MKHALLCLAIVSFAAIAADKPARPNIVFILSDDHRWDGLGAAGNAEIRTPHLDRFCGQAVHFINGAVAVPQCCPSRAVLLTGLFPHQNGYFSNKSWTKDAGNGFSRPTAIELLRDAGYETALIGKWHIRPPPWKVGFSEVRTWMPQGADAYVDAKLAKGKSDKVDEFSGHVTEVFSTDAIRFLRKREETPEQPFFLWLAYTAPHTPQKPVPERCCEPYYRLPAAHCPPGFPEGEKKTGPWAQYYGAITHLDEQLGRVLEAIDGGVLKENTVVIFLGDNGWMMGSHGRFGKNLPDDESTRVPFGWRRASICRRRGWRSPVWRLMKTGAARACCRCCATRSRRRPSATICFANSRTRRSSRDSHSA
jgi:arylsulfatase A-like enzyme